MADEILISIKDMIHTFCVTFDIDIDTGDELTDSAIDCICNALEGHTVGLTVEIHEKGRMDCAVGLTVCVALCYRVVISPEQPYRRLYAFIMSNRFIKILLDCIVRYETCTTKTDYMYITLLMSKLIRLVPGVFLKIFKYCVIDSDNYSLIFFFNRYLNTCTKTEREIIELLKNNRTTIDKKRMKETIDSINLETYDKATKMCFILQCLFKYDNTLRRAVIKKKGILWKYTRTLST